MQPNMSAVAHLSNPSNSNRHFCMNKLNNHAKTPTTMPIQSRTFQYVHTNYISTYTQIPTTQSLATLQSYLQIVAISEMFLPGSTSVFSPSSYTSLASHTTSATFSILTWTKMVHWSSFVPETQSTACTDYVAMVCNFQ